MTHWRLALASALSLIVLLAPDLSLAGTASSGPVSGNPAFQHRGFYLHGGWFFKHPFAVRTWQRADFAGMFTLLRSMGYDRVMIWPMLESIPAPLSEQDAAALRAFRATIADAETAGLECWLTLCPNLLSPPEIAAKPWLQRNPYPVWKPVHLDNPAEAQVYLAHRAAMLAIVNNADGYVTIDGDPGGYTGAKPADWLKVLQSDREAIDRFGVAPKRQKIIPWVWCGWGTKGVWQEPIEPFVRAEMEALQAGMTEPWELLPGRSHDEKHGNGRINVGLADELGLMPRSTLFCYEAIEFEPCPPAAVLQFDSIRRILKEEVAFARVARGVFGNAQQPVMVLPNLYFFARGACDPSYLDRPDEQVLADLAELLGGPAELLVPAWSCLQRQLEQLPEALPARLRAAQLTKPAGLAIPGGPVRYLDILARQVESQRGLLAAIRSRAASDEEAAARLADGVAALVDWWKVHGFVLDGSGDEPFQWRFANVRQYEALIQWGHTNVKDRKAVISKAAELLEQRGVLLGNIAQQRLTELLR